MGFVRDRWGNAGEEGLGEEFGMHDAQTPVEEGANGRAGRSIGDLTKQLSRDASALVRGELELARMEVAAKAKRLAVGAALVVAAVVLGLVVLGALSAAAIMALMSTFAGWLSALIFAGVVLVVVAVLAKVGVSRLRAGASPVPERVVESVKEDVQWVKTRAQPGLK